MEKQTIVDEQKIIEAWNRTPGTLPHSGIFLSGTRRQLLLERIETEPDWLERFFQALEKFPLQEWPRGRRPTIESLLKPDVVTKILEGAYDRIEAPQNKWFE